MSRLEWTFVAVMALVVALAGYDNWTNAAASGAGARAARAAGPSVVAP